MVKIIDGNLLDSKADIIAHQVNCQGAFNSGVARAIRQANQKVYEDYKVWTKAFSPEKLLGTVLCVEYGDRCYAHLYAQKNYGYDGKQYTDTRALENCFRELRKIAKSENLSIAMPYKISCVRGGANWDEVYPLIEKIFEDCKVELWRLDVG